MSEDSQQIRAKAIKLLAVREHSRQQLFRKLSVKGYSDDDIHAVLTQLTAENLQSDERFCESFISSHIHRGQGPVRIAAELGEHGVDESLVSEYLDFSDPVWKQTALDVQRKRFAAMPENYQERAKQARFLQYRGFTPEQIRSVLNFDDD
ncbi:MAG: regulatory protein RecX [Gammaproteobacteria bacterium]|nr:regulatory protein RecX [Gammaproteobacteria bacterium]